MFSVFFGPVMGADSHVPGKHITGLIYWDFSKPFLKVFKYQKYSNIKNLWHCKHLQGSAAHSRVSSTKGSSHAWLSSMDKNWYLFRKKLLPVTKHCIQLAVYYCFIFILSYHMQNKHIFIRNSEMEMLWVFFTVMFLTHNFAFPWHSDIEYHKWKCISHPSCGCSAWKLQGLSRNV